MSRKERYYTATADTGRDYIDFEFKSCHRADSRANFEDAKAEYKSRHGHTVKIIRTTLCQEQ